MNKTLILEYDDFHWKSPENCIDQINKFVQLYPKIKLSLFTPVILNNLQLNLDKEWIHKVRELSYQGNIKLAIHGLYHTPEEFKYLNKTQAEGRISLAESTLQSLNIPFAKAFRGPHWGMNEDSVEALNSLGYTHWYNHTDYKHLESKFNGKVIYYNWNLKDEEPPDTDLIIAHGHTHNTCSNGILETFDRVRRYIENNNPEFLFVHEV